MADKPVAEKPIEEQRQEFIATMEAEQAAAKPAEVPAAEAPAAEEPAKPAFRFEASDGTVYEADSDKALYEKVSKALNDTKTAVKDRERQIHELKAVKPAAETPAPEPQAAEAYDKKRYYELMDQDPALAADYLDSYRYGVDNPREVFGRVAQDRIAQRVGMEFYAKVTEYAQIETPAVNKMLFDRMEEQGRPKTSPDLMALTYYELKNEGKIPKAAHTRRKAEVPPDAPPESPTGGGGGQPSGDLTYAQMMAMNKEELAAHMRKKGIQVYTS